LGRGVGLTHCALYLWGLGPPNKPKSVLVLLELGVHLSYRPGDVVALSGKLFMHEVGELSGGVRICVSHYMKDNVHEHLEVNRPNWPR